MRQSIALHTFGIFLLLAHSALASPLVAHPFNLAERYAQAQNLERRACANPCGYNGFLCCPANAVCYTDKNNEAQCGTQGAVATVAAAGQGAGVYTTTFLATQVATVVSVYTLFQPSPTAAVCNANLNQQSCGPICCASDQFCAVTGQCSALADSTGGAQTPIITAAASTTTITAAIRPTSQSTLTITSTASDVPFQTPVAANGTSEGGMQVVHAGSGLSGGAIAGIVIGVLAALFIIGLIIFCCCVKGLFDLIFGRKEKVTTETRIHAHHGDVGPPPPPENVGFFGRMFGRGDRPARPPQEKKNNHTGLKIVGAIVAILVALGIKRSVDKRAEREKEQQQQQAYNSPGRKPSRYAPSDHSSDYTYTYTDATSPSSVSSDDRRTRITRASGRPLR